MNQVEPNALENSHQTNLPQIKQPPLTHVQNPNSIETSLQIVAKVTAQPNTSDEGQKECSKHKKEQLNGLG